MAERHDPALALAELGFETLERVVSQPGGFGAENGAAPGGHRGPGREPVQGPHLWRGLGAQLLDQPIEVEERFDSAIPVRSSRRLTMALETVDNLRHLRVLGCQLERASIVRQRFTRFVPALMQLAEGAQGGQVVRCLGEDSGQLTMRLVELAEVGQGPAQGDASGEVVVVAGQAAAADLDGLTGFAGTTQLLGQLREDDRRRVVLDPPSQLEDPGSGGHR